MKKLLADSSLHILLAFFLVCIISLLINAEGLKNISLFLTLLGMLILGFLLFKTDRGKKVILYGLFTATLFSCVDTIYNSLYFKSLNIHKLFNYYIIGDRISYSNHNGVALVIGIGLLFGVRYYMRKRNLAALIYILISLAGLLLTTSRSAIMATFFSLILFVFFNKYKFSLTSFLKLISASVLLFFILKSLFSFLPSEYQEVAGERLWTEPKAVFNRKICSTGNFTGRIELVRGAINYLRNRRVNKLFGIGFGNWGISRKSAYEVSYTAVHNGYLLLLMENGHIGLSLYIIFCLILVKNSWKIFRRKKEKNRMPVIFAFIYFLVFSIAQNAELTSSVIMFVIGIVIAENHFGYHELNKKKDED
ncbi:O-antigen ligase family protein [candidate division WOR-3 bacterium]|nr:O-antigen ligase family protein [candidate division WOR-3 bacterium]